MRPALLLLSTVVATLRSALSSLFNNKRKAYLLLIFSYLLTQQSFSQTKQTEHVEQIWLAYMNQTRFSDKWGMWADLHLRTKDDFVKDFSQSIIRLGLTYYLNDDTKLTAGYAYISSYPTTNQNVTVPEHRPWQQIQWHSKYSKLRLMQWFRLEERFRKKLLNPDELSDEYSFNFRLRYNILFMVPLSKQKFQPKSLSLVVNNEAHVNFGKQIVYNYFDQNRFFLGFNYHVNKHDNLQFGYMNVFQQLAAGNKYRSNNGIRIFYFNNIDLRKKSN